MAQLAQRLCFDLTHPLPGHVELLAQFFQGAGTAILQTKAQGDDPLLPGRQAFKDVQQFPPQQCPVRGLLFLRLCAVFRLDFSRLKGQQPQIWLCQRLAAEHHTGHSQCQQ